MKHNDISFEAMTLHNDAHVFDLHVDSFLLARQFGYDFLKRHKAWLPYGAIASHADLPRMIEGGVDTIGFGVVTNPLQKPANCWKKSQRQISLFHDACNRSNDLFVFARDPEAAIEAKNRGQRAGFMGLEGAHCLGDDLENVAKAFSKGVRYITLTHFSSNKAGYCAKGIKANPDQGITFWGRELIEIMNDLGLIVDVAHINKAGFIEAVNTSKIPCIVSHGAVHGIMPLWRNNDDESLKALCDKGGVFGVIFAPQFLSPQKERSAKHLFRNIDYIVQNFGDDFVCLGSDFDGYIQSTPEDLRDMSRTPRITQIMLDNNYSEERIRKILGGNFLRVWKDVIG